MFGRNEILIESKRVLGESANWRAKLTYQQSTTDPSTTVPFSNNSTLTQAHNPPAGLACFARRIRQMKIPLASHV
jgi:hypothetical protein